MTYPPPPQRPLKVQGYRGEVIFDGWNVTIRHSGFGSNDASVPIEQLSGVELRPANLASAGLITLLVAGAIPPGRQRMARTNPLSLQFWPGQTKQFTHLRDVLLQAIATRRTPVAPQPYAPPQHQYAPPTAPVPSLTEQLQQLGQMVQQGLLTPQEFEQAKQRLLGG